MKGRNAFFLILAGLLLIPPCGAEGATRYVANTTQFGNVPVPPYDNPFFAAGTVQGALDLSVPGDTVLVAGIPFRAFLTTGRSYPGSATIPKGVVLLGGWDIAAAFAGFGASVDQRLFAPDSLWTFLTPAGNLGVEFEVDSFMVFDTTGTDPDLVIDTAWVLSGPDSNTVFSGFAVLGTNRTTGDGGGVTIRVGSPTITHNVLVDNKTVGRGGAVFVGGGSPRIEHNTVAFTVSDQEAGAIHVAGGSPTIRNNIIYAIADGYGISCDGAADSPLIAYNVFFDNGGNDIVGCSGDGTNLFATNPVFCNDVDQDYRIFLESPILGAGANGETPGAWGIGCRAGTKYVSIQTGRDVFPYDEPNKAATSIADVLTITSPGDTIRVASGTYVENVVIPAGIVLEGGWDANFNVFDPFLLGTRIRPAEAESPAIRIQGSAATNFSYLVLTGAFDGDGALLDIGEGAATLDHISVVGNDAAFSGSLIRISSGASMLFRYGMAAMNEGAAVFECDGGLTIEQSNFYENEQEFAPGCSPSLSDTTRTNPFFCDPANGDFRFYSEGDLNDPAPGGTPLGALSVGCNFSSHYVFTTAGDGVFPYQSPANATSDISKVLAIALPADTIRLASGTYDGVFTVSKGIYLEGGWNDSTFTKRNHAVYPTVLRGTVAGEPTVTFDGFASQFAPKGGLDGFFITHADGVNGPGILVRRGARPVLRRNTVHANRVDFVSRPDHRAAGVIIQGANVDSQSVATLRNNTIAENVMEGAATSDLAASGIFIRFAGVGSTDKFSFRDNIFAFNEGGRAGLVLDDVWVEFVRNISFGNVNAAAADSNYVSVSPFVTFDSTKIKVRDPLFCDTEGGDFKLSTCSPAIASVSGDTVIGALKISSRCICDNEVWLVNPASSNARFPFSGRNSASRKISWLDSLLTAGDTVKIGGGSFEDEFELVGGVVYKGGYSVETFRDNNRGRVSRIAGNSAHRVVFGGDGVDSTTWVDGINIAGGRADSGGAIFLRGNATPRFTNCKIIESRANITGGAVLAIEDAAPRFENNQFYLNSVDDEGAIIHLAGAGGLLADNTITDNRGGGWAVWVDGCAPELYNNSITYNDNGVRATGSTGVIFDHNNVFRHDVDYDVDFDSTGQANISNGPLYCRRDQYIYTVFDHSPNVAAGRNGTIIGALGVGCSTPRHFVSLSGSNVYPYATAATAAHNLQDALDVASLAGFSNPADSTDEVRVAAGTYTGSIRVPTNVRVLGGYTSGFGVRDPDANRTIIDAAGSGTAVVIDSGAGGVGRRTTRFDGFTVQGGKGDLGGGIRVEKAGRPQVYDNYIRHCDATLGGGIYVAEGAVPILARNLVYGDTAEVGAGLYMVQSVGAEFQTTSRCTLNTFADNHCTVDTGGVVHLTGSNPRFYKNIVAYSTGGSGFFFEGDTAYVRNNLFWQNAGGDSLPLGHGGAHVIADPGFCDREAEKYGVLFDLDAITAGESPIRDQCAVTVWGSEGVGCTRPGHRFLVYWDHTNINRPVFPYVCSQNAARSLSVVFDRVNPGDTIDVAGSGPNNDLPLDGAVYDGVLTLDKPVVLRGGFDAAFTLEHPHPDSFNLRTVIAAPGWRNFQRSAGSLLTIRQSGEAAENGTLIIDSSTVVSGIMFVNGRAELTNGGAIRCLDGASPTIRDCWFEKNSSKNWGGAISMSDAVSPRIYDNYFYRNEGGVGGAVYLFRTSDPVIRGNIFSENEADEYGGLRMEKLTGGASIDNNVFRKNARGAISLSEPEGSVIIRNNVVTRNGGYGIGLFPYFDGIRKPELSYNNVWANSSGQFRNLEGGEGSVSTNPLFCNTRNPVDTLFHRAKTDFFTYQECSPMLFAGSDPLSDLNAHIGQARLSDPVCADTVSPGLTIAFVLHSTIPGAANVYVIPTETIRRDSILLRMMYADEEQEEVVIGNDTLLLTVYNFDSTEVEMERSDTALSIFRSDNLELRTADTLIVEARAVDLCGKVGTVRRFFSSRQFVTGKDGVMRSTDRRLLVRVPASSFGKSGVALMEVLEKNDGPERPLAGPYTLHLTQIAPRGPIELTVGAAGLGVETEDFSGLALYRLEEDGWAHVESRVDPAREEVVATVEGGGTFALFHSAEIRSGTVVPKTFALYGNTPNPFNPVTRIVFDIPVREEVSLRVYDIRGRQIRVLEDAPLPAGRYDYSWDGKDDHSRSVGSGVYFYRLTAGEDTAVRKMMLIR
ncbi:MAG: right-handed parallel beta-helix repeat-containing protein [Candidatus Eisenbacteria bacterium]